MKSNFIFKIRKAVFEWCEGLPKGRVRILEKSDIRIKMFNTVEYWLSQKKSENHPWEYGCSMCRTNRYKYRHRYK